MYPGRYPAAMGGSQFLPIDEEAQFGVLMVAEVARLATRLFVHSEHTADLIELDCGRRPEVIFQIPSPELAAPEPPPLGGAQPRASRPTADMTTPPLVASFGFVSPAKCSEVVLAAMARVPAADLALVGHSGEDFLDTLRARSVQLGHADRVTVTGKVDDTEYRRLARADVDRGAAAAAQQR